MANPAQRDDHRALARRHDARRERLILQLLPAVEQMLSAGEAFQSLSVERLITRAEISRTTFYRYFRDKGELLAELSRSAIEQIVTVTEQLWSLPDDAGYDDVADAIEEVVRVFLPHTALMNAVTSAAATNPDVQRQFQQGFEAARAAAATAIARGRNHGIVRPSLDPDTTAGWLTWMAERGMSQLVAPATPEQRAQLIHTLTSIIWFTLYDGHRDASAQAPTATTPP
jgi:TetR/AcrR family transcriptional regulator, ethionamide resistance regulator